MNNQQKAEACIYALSILNDALKELLELTNFMLKEFPGFALTIKKGTSEQAEGIHVAINFTQKRYAKLTQEISDEASKQAGSHAGSEVQEGGQ